VSDLPGPSAEFIGDYLIRIRDRMVDLFSITVAEAEGRIARDFGSLDLLDRETGLWFGHEDPGYWAHSVYYGVGVLWWHAGPKDLRPTPWH
jgi:hypothetical protein